MDYFKVQGKESNDSMNKKLESALKDYNCAMEKQFYATSRITGSVKVGAFPDSKV